MVGGMKILQIAPVPREFGGVDTGGIATHAWGLASSLSALGHEVAVLAHNRDQGVPWPQSYDGIKVYGGRSFGGAPRAKRLMRPSAISAVMKARRTLGPGWKLRWVASAVAACCETIDAFRPDIIHVHSVEGRFAVAHASNLYGVPIVATAHSTHYVEFVEEDVRDENRALVERNLADATDVIFVSKWVAERHEQVFPGALDHAHTVVLPNPIAADVYKPVPRKPARERLGIAKDEVFLLTLGNLIPRKDPLTFIRSVGILRSQGLPVRVIMVGSGPLQSEMEALIAELGLGDVIRLEGHAPQEAINDYYSAADVYVFPSLMETWGLAAVEAMLCGCPIVGTFDVMPEVVPEYAGVFVPSHDPVDLAAGLTEAIAREWDRDAIREFALGYDWKKQVGGFDALYQEILARRK